MKVYETYAWQECQECTCGTTHAGRTHIFSSVLKAQQFWENHVPGLAWNRLVTCYVARGEDITFPSTARHSHANHVHRTGYAILDHIVE